VRAAGPKASILKAAAATALLALGVPAYTTAAESTKTFSVFAHLHAVNDPVLTPGCGFYGPFPDCRRIDYSGTGTYTGDLTGTIRYTGRGFFSENGQFYSFEEGSFTGRVRGCGKEMFTFFGGRSLNRVEDGGFSGNNLWGIRSSPRNQLTGGMYGSSFYRTSRSSFDDDLAGHMRCAGTSTEKTGRRTRLVLGPTRGMRRARAAHPFRIRVRAIGGRVSGVRVLVRNARGRRVGRSRRFSVAQRRKVVRVRVSRRLDGGRYRVLGAGRDAAGRRVRAVRRVQLPH
jgi:hypothetical protein